MWEKIRVFFRNLWQRNVWHSMTSVFNRLFLNKSAFTAEDKYQFIKYLLSGQTETAGFALRHVNSNKTKDTNVLNGFTGDAVSISMTSHIMSEVLAEKIETCSWHLLNTGEISFLATNMNRPIIIGRDLAARMFDCLHQKILQFIRLNFSEETHHYMLIKDMNGATGPYDIKEIYPTGKCGKQRVKASQIVKVFSNDRLGSPEEMLQDIERGVLCLARPARHLYSQESTRAILAILREIKLNSNDQLLTRENVHKRLITAEVDSDWTNYRFHEIYDEGGYFNQFTDSISLVNDDLEHFRALM